MEPHQIVKCYAKQRKREDQANLKNMEKKKEIVFKSRNSMTNMFNIQRISNIANVDKFPLDLVKPIRFDYTIRSVRQYLFIHYGTSH